jgi:membrane-bound ClpP family serine protease
MKLVGVVLMILGIVALIYAGIDYKRQRTVLDVGGIKATVTENKSVQIAPVVGAISLIGGVALLVIRRVTL